MTQLEMLTTLVDACRQLPENNLLRRALFRADHRIEVLRARRARMTRRLYQFYGQGNRLLCQSYFACDKPHGTVDVFSFYVWRYPDAERPPEVNERYPSRQCRPDTDAKSITRLIRLEISKFRKAIRVGGIADLPSQ